MDDFIFSINATVPIFLVILLGWFLKKIGLIHDAFTEEANKYVFKVALPVLLFRDIATTSVLEHVNIRFVLFCFFRNDADVCHCMDGCKTILQG